MPCFAPRDRARLFDLIGLERSQLHGHGLANAINRTPGTEIRAALWHLGYPRASRVPGRSGALSGPLRGRPSRRYLWGSHLFCHGRDVREVPQLDAGILAGYRQELLWTPGPSGAMYKEGTLFQAQRMVRLFLRWLHESELTLVDLAASWVLRRPPDSARNVPTVDQVARLLLVPDARTAAGLRNRAILELLYGTGVRAHECYAIDLDSFDLEVHSFTCMARAARIACYRWALACAKACAAIWPFATSSGR